MSNRRRHIGDREEPDPSKCIGVFGLSLYTTERQLDKEFGRSAIFTSIIVISMNPPPGLKHITNQKATTYNLNDITTFLRIRVSSEKG